MRVQKGPFARTQKGKEMSGSHFTMESYVSRKKVDTMGDKREGRHLRIKYLSRKGVVPRSGDLQHAFRVKEKEGKTCDMSTR